jgi:hypothetical protein
LGPYSFQIFVSGRPTRRVKKGGRPPKVKGIPGRPGRPAKVVTGKRIVEKREALQKTKKITVVKAKKLLPSESSGAPSVDAPRKLRSGKKVVSFV